MPQTNRTVRGVLGGLLGLVALSAVAGVLVAATVTPAIAMTGIAGSQALSLFDKLPTYLQVDAPMEPSSIVYLDPEGKEVELASFYQQNRVPVAYDQVAPVLYDAILSSEDKTFYEHGGINLGATVSAMFDYVRGTSTRGASTISQQYVKNVLVQRCEQDVSPNEDEYLAKLEACWTDATNASGADGMERKLQEMRYAIQIEKDYSKNDILLGYLNLANFGGSTYGIESAAKYYYGTSAKKLNLNQAATLAGIVQNPNLYRIDRVGGTRTNEAGEAVNGEDDGYRLTKVRRDYVLKRMLADGKITDEQYETTKAAPITPDVHRSDQGCGTAKNNAYFCQYVRSIIESDEAFGETDAERRELLKRGGLKIYTTMDIRVQRAGTEAMSRYVEPHMENIKLGAAGVTLEASTGRVLAIVQNTKFSESQNPDPGQTSLVYATNQKHGGSTGFNVGSTYKLFTLIEWLEQGRSVNEVLNGRMQLFDQYTMCGDTIPNKDRIHNFNKQSGSVSTIREFTRRSTNTGYLAMAVQMDTCDINKVADRMGVTLANGTPVTDGNLLYESVLGSKAISPMAMAGAYATVANKGVYCTPRAIDKIVKQDGTEMPLPKSSCEQVITPEVAATAAYTLEGVMRGGGTGSASRTYDGVPLIGKTGTHESTQTMMVESSTEATTAVWVGNVEGIKLKGKNRAEQQSLYNRYSHGVQLAQLRHRIAPALQRAANEIYGGDRFPSPDRNLTRRVYTELPSVIGLSIGEAKARLENAGFSVNVGSPVDSELAEGAIAEQSPGAGRVASGTSVTISPSNGQGATLPDVRGRTVADARAQLNGAGFLNIDVHPSCTSGGGNDDGWAPQEAIVTAMNPAAGPASKNARVQLSCT